MSARVSAFFFTSQIERLAGFYNVFIDNRIDLFLVLDS